MMVVGRLIGTLLTVLFWATTHAAEFTRADHRTIHMKGSIAEGDLQRLQAVYDDAVSLIRVGSSGGVATAGIELGHFIFEKQLDLEVVQLCGSSCANYMFVAARKKYLPKGSMLAFHGSLMTTMFESGADVRAEGKARNWKKEEVATELRRRMKSDYAISLQEDDFYKRIGVNIRLLTDLKFVFAGPTIDQLQEAIAPLDGPTLEAMWSPSATALRERYDVKNVFEYGRPPELDRVGYWIDTKLRLMYVGDVDLPPLPRKIQ